MPKVSEIHRGGRETLDVPSLPATDPLWSVVAGFVVSTSLGCSSASGQP